MTDELVSRWRLIVFFTGNVCVAAGLFVHAFSFNFYLRELGFTASMMGHQVAAMTMGGLAGLLPAGVAIDRLGTRAALLGGVVVTTIGLAVAAVVRQPVAILAAGVVIGVGGATCRVSWGPAIMRLSTESNRSRLFTWNVAILIGSGAVWTALAGALPAQTNAAAAVWRLSGTQLVLLGGAAISALALPCYAALHLPSLGARTARRLTLIPRIPREVRTIVPLIAAWMLATALILPFFNVFFADRFAMPVSWIGALFASAHVGTAIVLIGAAELARRWGSQRMLAVWIVVYAPCLWGLAASTVLSVSVGLYVLQGLIAPVTNPLIDQLVLERVTPERHGVVAAWRNAAAEASGAVGASVGGWVLDATSFSALFGIAGVVAALAGAGLLVALRSRATHVTPSESPA
jgi:MFS family permease